VNVDVGEQLELELGEEFGIRDSRIPNLPTIELDLVVCQRCTGHHPTERCPQRVVCPVCTGAHHASLHLGTGAA